VKFRVTLPRTRSQLRDYYFFRWWVLRRPWHQPLGSERDDLDEKAIHVMAVSGKDVIACGRLHFNSRAEAQFRYMGVHKDMRGKGVGRAVLTRLEGEARKRGAHYCWFNAREGAVPFYEICGYSIFEPSYILYKVIPHWKMMKELRLKVFI